MSVLNFYDPNNMEYMEKLATKILAKCSGMLFEEVIDRLSSKLPPQKIIEKVESVWIENVTDKNEILDGLRAEENVKIN